MNDISCAAEIYSMLREFIPVDQVEAIAEEIVSVLMNEGYSFAQIEKAMGEHDEIYDAIEDATEYGEEIESDDYMEDDGEYMDEE